MKTHFQRDLGELKQALLMMGGAAEQALRKAARALDERNPTLAFEVVAEDRQINEMEMQLDRMGQQILALHQPVAGDLRFITAAFKITHSLERIGDLAVNMAERVAVLSQQPPLPGLLDLDSMHEHVRGMLRDALNSLVDADPAAARAVCARDDEVDDLNRAHFRRICEQVQRDRDTVERALMWLSVSRCLERVADLATNIAEDVVFLVEAVDIRHGGGSQP